jgi:hypothetical protein
MGMPKGDTPEKAQAFYQYLESRHQTEGRVTTWHVDWLSLAWLWGFAIGTALVLLFWVLQYRSNLGGGLYPTDRWSGYTSELARPASRFFVLFSIFVTAFAVALIVGHIVNGQTF